MLFDAENFSGIPQILLSRCLFLNAFLHIVIYNLSQLVSFFLFFRLPLYHRLVIQFIIVEIVGNRKKDVEYLSVTFTCQHEDGHHFR